MLILQNILLTLCSMSRNRHLNRLKKTSNRSLKTISLTQQRDLTIENIQQNIKLPSFQEAFGHIRSKIYIGSYQNEMADVDPWPFCNQSIGNQYNYYPNNYNHSLTAVSSDNLYVYNYPMNTNILNNITLENVNILSADIVDFQAITTKEEMSFRQLSLENDFNIQPQTVVNSYSDLTRSQKDDYNIQPQTVANSYYDLPSKSKDAFDMQPQTVANSYSDLTRIPKDAFDIQPQTVANSYSDLSRRSNDASDIQPQFVANSYSTIPSISKNSFDMQPQIVVNSYSDLTRIPKDAFDIQPQTVANSYSTIPSISKNSFDMQPQTVANSYSDLTRSQKDDFNIQPQTVANSYYDLRRSPKDAFDIQQQIGVYAHVNDPQIINGSFNDQKLPFKTADLNKSISEDDSSFNLLPPEPNILANQKRSKQASVLNQCHGKEEAKKPKTNSLSKSNNSKTKIQNNVTALEKMITFDINKVKIYFFSSYNKLSILTKTIDNQITFHLSNEKIKENFIYSIFFDNQFIIKDEFIFLLFILPEIEVITRVYSQVKPKHLNVDILNDNLQAYKEKVKELILKYKNVIKTIVKKNDFAKFIDITKIIDYFLITMNIEIQNFRTTNYNFLKPIFSKCHSIKFYKYLVDYGSKATTPTKLYRLVNFCFYVFLNQDWLCTISEELHFFKYIYFYVIIKNPHYFFREKSRAMSLLYNLNKLVELTNGAYFKDSGLSFGEYDANNMHFVNRLPVFIFKRLRNGVVCEYQLSLRDYLELKYLKYCENLFLLYLNRDVN